MINILNDIFGVRKTIKSLHIFFMFGFLIIILSSAVGKKNEGVSKSLWLTDFEDAKKEADNSDRYLMLYFSGSDWCKPCIQLSKNILNTETFSKYAEENFVALRIDFPKMKKNRLSKEQNIQNEALAEKYNPNGVFPLLVILDKEEKVIGFTGFANVSPGEYVSIIENIIQK